MTAEPPVQEAQVVLRIPFNLDAAKLVNALAVLEEIAGERDALADLRQRKIIPCQRLERPPARLGAAQGTLDLRDLLAREFMDPVARGGEFRPAPGRRSVDDRAHSHDPEPRTLNFSKPWGRRGDRES